jgi:hypothetical protein
MTLVASARFPKYGAATWWLVMPRFSKNVPRSICFSSKHEIFAEPKAINMGTGKKSSTADAAFQTGSERGLKDSFRLRCSHSQY